MNLLRKRDLLLSLKYCTIESCFSVPMLNLTLTQFPFVVAFAVTGLGWRSGAIGWLAAIHHFCNAIQPPIYWALRRRFSLHRIIVISFWFNALPWFAVLAFPQLDPPTRNTVFAVVVIISTLANSISAVAWSAATGELVPLHIRGRFFGRRNMIFGFWTLVVVLVAGTVADHYNNALLAFGGIFAAASLMRLTGLYFLLRMKFPPQVMSPQQQPERIGDYLAVFRSRDYMWLVAFIGAWGLALNIGAPFYSVYVLRELPLSIRDLTVFTTLASLGGLLSLPTWGALGDRFGSKPVMLACAFLWVGTALPAWLLAGPSQYLHLYLNYFLIGAVTAGFQLCQFNLMVEMIPARTKAPFISVFLAVTSLLTAAGPLLGAQLLVHIPNHLGEFLGQPILRFHVVFIGSLALCLLATHLLQPVREPEERPLSELVRVMRTMREFNPVLGVAAIAELVFTPRRITRFAAKSLRNLRKQTSDIAEVGEELATAGLSILRPRRRPFPAPLPPRDLPEESKDP